MKLYFVIEENVSNNSKSKGTKYICKKGVRYNYGEFRKEIGFEVEHKADLEISAARKYHETSEFRSSADVWIQYIEIREI